ncbi:MAG: DUF1993 domain-containing protein [Hyphomicrobiales bacterium]|nr:MAG: DUF1993 domain-containing protein [Hyphomicrobiales bacterium]
MTVSLHTAVVGTYQQMLPQLLWNLDKAEKHCTETGMSFDALGEARLAPDMWTLAKQISQSAHHSARAIEAVRKGSFSPDPDPIPSDLSLVRKEIKDAIVLVNAVQPGELDAIAHNDMQFRAGKYSMMFDVSDFLMTFSLPNFYFHVTTTYNILRTNGVQLGKADFIGFMRNRK